jgi:AraC-like DNA-binding protein
MLAEPDAGAAQEQQLSELMIAVIERFTPWRTVTPSLVAVARECGRFDWRIRRAIERMRQAPHEAGDVSSLAREAGLSRAHFYRLFERSTNITPHVYFNVLRMELAVNAIVHENESLGAVSQRLGFSVPAHFTRFFRDHAGVKPSEFRNVARLGVPAAVQ